MLSTYSAAVALLLVAAASADQCDSPDTNNAKCTCNGAAYDFSQIQPSDGNSYFSGPDGTNEYMYYFQMTGGGLPSDDGSMPYCTFGSGANTGNAVGQGEITGDTCYPIGLVAQQSWEIDTSQNPQVISITFSGGQEGRQAIIAVTCDPSADSPTFTVKGETRTMVYEVDMTSKFACAGGPAPPGPPSPPGPGPLPPSPPFPPGPSPPGPNPKPSTKGGSKTGEIFSMIVLIGGAMYFVGGFVFLKVVKKQEGKENQIPQYSFWANCCGLSKDGMRFTWAKATGKDASYASL